MRTSVVVIARALALLWAGFWTWFFVAESLAWQAPARVMAFWSGVGLTFVVLAILPWWFEATGALLLVAAGPLIGAAYEIWAPPHLPLSARVITSAMLSGPPLLAGVLLLLPPRVSPPRLAARRSS